MKHIICAIIFLLAVCMTSCMDSAERKAREFADNFALMIADRDLASIRKVYPDLRKSDSIVLNYDPKEMKVSRIDESESFLVEYSPEITIEIKGDGKGSYLVADSRGLFGYPVWKKELAEKTGMWDPDLTDREMADRINDSGFYEYLKETQSERSINILTIGVAQWPNNLYGVCPIINNTDQSLEWSDYTVTVTYNSTAWNDSLELHTPALHERTVRGIDLAPHGVHNVEIRNGRETDWNPERVVAINLNIPEEKLMSKFAFYKGQEYNMYLKSK